MLNKNLPKEPGFYWGKSDDCKWWNLIIQVYGDSPFFRIDGWDISEDDIFADIDRVCEFGPAIDSPEVIIEKSKEFDKKIKDYQNDKFVVIKKSDLKETEFDTLKRFAEESLGNIEKHDYYVAHKDNKYSKQILSLILKGEDENDDDRNESD